MIPNRALLIGSIAFLACLSGFAYQAPAASATLIVVQAGHGGSDPGAIGPDGVHESDINLAIAVRLNALLLKHGVQTVMTRTDDSDQDPQENMDLANDRNADAYIDIHNEGSDSAADSGDEMWFAPKSAADFKMANEVHLAVMRAIRKYGYKDVVDGGLTQADPSENWMIERGKMPALIIEGLYVTNEYEAGLLETSSFQQALAQGIYDGIAEYFGLPQEQAAAPATAGPVAATSTVKAAAPPAPPAEGSASPGLDLVRAVKKNPGPALAAAAAVGLLLMTGLVTLGRTGRRGPGPRRRLMRRRPPGRHRKRK